MQMKPQLIRTLAAVDHPLPDHDETIFRRTAKEVMVTVLRAMMVETGASAPRVVKLLKYYAVDLDQPVKIELIFDVIAALESAPNRS
ncbi:MAG: hypothetical protein ABJB01_09340 [Rudaea sp.]